MVILTLIYISIILAIVIGLGLLVLKLASSAVIYPRIALAVVLGIALAQTTPLVNSGLLNFLIWSVISFGGIFLLSVFPRINCALKFFCTALGSYIATEVVIALIGGFFCAVLQRELVVSTAMEIIIKVICTGFSLFVLFGELGYAMTDLCVRSRNFLLVNLQRIAASLLYGAVAFVMICVAFYNQWHFSDTAGLWILGGTAALTFVVDIFLTAQGIWD